MNSMEVDGARPEHHHRDLSGGTARAAVFGVSDGLVTNVSLILGVAGAHPAASFVRLAGLAGLVAGAVSMAAGEYVSMTAQRELLERELAIERRELARRPNVEKIELMSIYRARGIDAATARELADVLMRDPETALATHAREELGIHPANLGAPRLAAVTSLLTFAAGAFVPLLPWLFGGGVVAVVLSIVLGVLGAASVGLALARFTDRSPTISALRHVAITAVAATATYAIGTLVGVSG